MTERTSVPPPQSALHSCHGPRSQFGWNSATEGEGVLGAGDVGARVGDGVGAGDGGAVVTSGGTGRKGVGETLGDRVGAGDGIAVGSSVEGRDCDTDSTVLPFSGYPLCIFASNGDRDETGMVTCSTTLPATMFTLTRDSMISSSVAIAILMPLSTDGPYSSTVPAMMRYTDP